MPRLELTTVIAAPAERCFDLSSDIDVHTGSMGASQEKAVAGVTSGLIGLGEEVTWVARHFCVRWPMTSPAMVDVVDYRLPLGKVVDGFIGSYLRQLLATRNDYIKRLAEAAG